MLEGRASNVDAFYAAGVRYMGLAHFSSNPVCPCAWGAGADNREALPHLGCEVVERMGELGMLVDLTHCGHRASADALKLAKGGEIVTRKAAVGLVGVFVVATLLGQSLVTSARETLNFVVLLVVATDLFTGDRGPEPDGEGPGRPRVGSRPAEPDAAEVLEPRGETQANPEAES